MHRLAHHLERPGSELLQLGADRGARKTQSNRGFLPSWRHQHFDGTANCRGYKQDDRRLLHRLLPRP